MVVRIQPTPTPHCLWQGVYYPTHAADATSQGGVRTTHQGGGAGAAPPLGGEATATRGVLRLARYLHCKFIYLFLKITVDMDDT